MGLPLLYFIPTWERLYSRISTEDRRLRFCYRYTTLIFLGLAQGLFTPYLIIISSTMPSHSGGSIDDTCAVMFELNEKTKPKLCILGRLRNHPRSQGNPRDTLDRGRNEYAEQNGSQQWRRQCIIKALWSGKVLLCKSLYYNTLKPVWDIDWQVFPYMHRQ